MGCWGIKALESDEGLDIIIELEKILPKDGHLQLEKLSGEANAGMLMGMCAKMGKCIQSQWCWQRSLWRIWMGSSIDYMEVPIKKAKK